MSLLQRILLRISAPVFLTLIGAGIVIATGIFTLYRERKLALARVASG